MLNYRSFLLNYCFKEFNCNKIACIHIHIIMHSINKEHCNRLSLYTNKYLILVFIKQFIKQIKISLKNKLSL